ncbi:MAG: hypothetical protein A4S09_09855 [Proteobacteria bacterium SG_bin7]|nr:MAG: hypothetical protein A4S09_09855 [Proteobacteria bacterium SG_bin7]
MRHILANFVILMTIFISNSSSFAEEVGEQVRFCFPKTTNDSYMGRMFLQSMDIGCRLATVEQRWIISANFNQTAHDTIAGKLSPSHQNTNLNSQEINFSISKGVLLNGSGLEMEFGAKYNRFFNGRNLVGMGADAVHSAIGANGYIPNRNGPTGEYVNGKNVAGFTQNMQGFVKVKLLNQDSKGAFFGNPDVAVSLVTQVPLSFENDLNKPQVGATIALQKTIPVALQQKILSSVSLMMAASVSCKMGKSESLGPEVRERLCGDSYFIGGAADLGEPGGLYTVIGMTHDRNRIYDMQDPNGSHQAYSGNYILSVRYGTEIYDVGITFREGRDIPLPIDRRQDFSAGIELTVFRPREFIEQISRGIENAIQVIGNGLRLPFGN